MPQRRAFMLFAVVASPFGARLAAAAASSDADAAGGIRAALERGAEAAVDLLGRRDGFLGNPKVRIKLPGVLDKAAKALRFAGQKDRVDALVVAMNRAAEAAVPEARSLLVQAARSIGLTDARRILTGGDDSVTRFFADKTRVPLGERFRPIVERETKKVELAERYNEVAGRAGSLGLLKGDALDIDRYVTGKALDGLYAMIAEEEKKIRKDPVGTGSALLARVFGRS